MSIQRLHHLLTLLVLLLLSTTIHAGNYKNIPAIGDIFGVPPYLTVSYYYALLPQFPIRKAFQNGQWPAKDDEAHIRPHSIYECLPPAGYNALGPRSYTCLNEEIPDDEKHPEGIKMYEEARARQVWDGRAPGACDANSGLAMETLHWGGWQHNCWSESAVVAEHAQTLKGQSQVKNLTTTASGNGNGHRTLAEIAAQHIAWNREALFWRRHVLLELAAHNYKLNCRIRAAWGRKNNRLEATVEWGLDKLGGAWSNRKIGRKMAQEEQKFWKETWEIRELAREVEKWVPVVFERRMQGKKDGYEWAGMGETDVQA